MQNCEKKISTSDLKTLIALLKSAYRNGCFAASNTCIQNHHGDLSKYSYTFADVSGSRCVSLFDGDSSYVDQLTKEYLALLEKLRTE